MEAIEARFAEINSRIDASFSALGERVDALANQIAACSVEHRDMHVHLQDQASRIERVEAAMTRGGLAGTRDSGMDKRKRPDRMVESRSNITTYDGKAKGQGLREWADDMRDHVSGYDAKLAAAMAAVDNRIEPVDDLNIADLGVDDPGDQASAGSS